MTAGWSNEVPQTDLGKHVIKQVSKRFNTSAFSRHGMDIPHSTRRSAPRNARAP